MEESDNEDTPNTNECAVERIQQTDCKYKHVYLKLN